MKTQKAIPIVTLLLLTVLLQVLARCVPGFGEWYAVSIYPILVGTLGRFYSIFPFSVTEFIIYLLVLLFVLGAIVGIISGKKKFVMKWLYGVSFTISLLLFLYTIGCGINYYRTPFSELQEYEISDYSTEELKELCLSLTVQVNEAAKLISLDENGNMSLDGIDVIIEARNNMESLGEDYPSLAGYYPTPKYIQNSELLSVQQLMGIYLPFTIEATVNKNMPVYDIPSTLCHELSHLKGFMREDEANFIAYLACMNSDIPEFRYSGALLAYEYSINALYQSGDLECYNEVLRQLCDTACNELVNNYAYWARYDTMIAEVSAEINDTYLKANSQENGVASYGRMVDLLLADYYGAGK